jgi:hypothetical protein
MSRIKINIPKQELYFSQNNEKIFTFPVSTSKYGVGNKEGSFKTPPGIHRVSEKIGDGAEPCTIFKKKKNTGKIEVINNTNNSKDLITTRILILEGIESGINKGKGIDSKVRNIWIHGTQEEKSIGKPASHGCIRMKNIDIIELFDLVDIDTLVEIIEE